FQSHSSQQWCRQSPVRRCSSSAIRVTARPEPQPPKLLSITDALRAFGEMPEALSVSGRPSQLREQRLEKKKRDATGITTVATRVRRLVRGRGNNRLRK